jgi:hypothetical protein
MLYKFNTFALLHYKGIWYIWCITTTLVDYVQHVKRLATLTSRLCMSHETTHTMGAGH